MNLNLYVLGAYSAAFGLLCLEIWSVFKRMHSARPRKPKSGARP